DLGDGRAQALGESLSQDDITVFYIHAADGQPQEETHTIASLTGGQAFAADDPEALREVFKRIDSMKPTRLEPAAPQVSDWFIPFAFAGLSVLCVQVCTSFGFRFTPW